MTMPAARIAPLDPPYQPEIEAMLAKWMPPGAAVEPLQLFRLLARNPEFMSRMRPLGAGILGSASSIDPHEREIVIDRVCARCGCEYEWGVHVTSFGAAHGISPEQIHATVTGAAEDAVWSERDSLLIQLADALHDHAAVSDTLWARLAAHWTPEQLMELIIIVGWYHLISFMANAARIPLEDWAARFPQP
jgi:4-carboxymuconolactone decarboxylase